MTVSRRDGRRDRPGLDGAARAAGERETGMSDRTPSSVRTGSRAGDAAAPADAATGESAAGVGHPGDPATGAQRAVQSGHGRGAARRQCPRSQPRRPAVDRGDRAVPPSVRRRPAAVPPPGAATAAVPPPGGRRGRRLGGSGRRGERRRTRRPGVAGPGPGEGRRPRTAPGAAAAAAHRHLVGAEDLAGPVDRAVLHLDGRGRRALRRAQRPRASSTPSTTCSASWAARPARTTAAATSSPRAWSSGVPRSSARSTSCC